MILREITLEDAKIWIEETDLGKILIKRQALRGKILNVLDRYEQINIVGDSNLIPLTKEVAWKILDRIESGSSYSSAFIFHNVFSIADPVIKKSEMEHKYTSTGIKFWQHQQQMESYRADKPNSIISTHISPEGACNLKCGYCSVTYRDTHSRIPLETIKQYVVDLKSRGLGAVILTGGGEPTAYKYFNELVQWIKNEMGLKVALITNGTLINKVSELTWKCFSWVRVSINIFEGWEEKISLPFDLLDSDCIVGCSMVFTAEHEATEQQTDNRISIFQKASKIADRTGASYVRILPNCLLEQRELIIQHRALERLLSKLDDKRFFQQWKIHGAPKSSVCHQAYFRPYLSEEPFHENKLPGTVYPCDSIVLNHGYQHFAKEYQICHASNILKFLDRELEMKFNPKERCSGCVFTDNVNMLNDWKESGIGKFSNTDLVHKEFV